MTMPSNKWEEAMDIIIQDMLVQYTAWVNGEPIAWNVKKAEAKLALTNAVKELIPEKKELLLSKEYSTPRELLIDEQEVKLNTNHQIIGYNQAIDDFEANLLKAIDSKQNQSDLTSDK